jgi:hypothetical protein
MKKPNTPAPKLAPAPRHINWPQLSELLARPIAYHPIFAKIAGGAVPGIFLSQAFYWTNIVELTNPTREGWFYKTRDEWQLETLLTRREQETARRILRGLGILEEKRQDVPARLYYRLNKTALLALLESYLPTEPPTPAKSSWRKTSQQVGTKRANKSEQNEPTLKGAKTTPEKTTISAAQIQTLRASLDEQQLQQLEADADELKASPAGRKFHENHGQSAIEEMVLRDWLSRQGN